MINQNDQSDACCAFDTISGIIYPNVNLSAFFLIYLSFCFHVSEILVSISAWIYIYK